MFRSIFSKIGVSNIVCVKRNLRGPANAKITRHLEITEEISQKVAVAGTTNDRVSAPTIEDRSRNNIKERKFPFFEKKPDKEKAPLTESNQSLKLKETVTPLWKVPYQQQLQIKYKTCVKLMRNLASSLKRLKLDLPRDPTGLPCALESTRPSPVTEHYRNKDEFSLRHGVDGKRKVGFFVGSFDGGEVFCVEPDELCNLKKEHLHVAKAFELFVLDSPYDICTSVLRGYWRRLVVRSNLDGEMMVIVIMHPQNLTEDEMDVEKAKLIEFFKTGPGKDCNITSLYFQACPHSRCTHQQAPFQHLAGKKYLLETIGELQLRISPDTFLQINSGGALVLYDTIKAFADVRKDTTLLDICCGAGAISLFLSKYVVRTIGIELSVQAIDDAKFNAELNEIKNASFYRGRAERLVPQIIPELMCSDCVAVVNPGRGGLELSVIHALRESKHLRRIIYIACKPDGKANDNFIELCRPAGSDRHLGKPFVPIHAIPVDMFPQTYHCELVLVFERID